MAFLSKNTQEDISKPKANETAFLQHPRLCCATKADNIFIACVGVDCNLGSHPRKRWITSLWQSSNCATSIQTVLLSAVIGNSLVRNPINAIKTTAELHILPPMMRLYSSNDTNSLVHGQKYTGVQGSSFF